jgi:uncharacterized protein (DUF302 family)
MRAVSISSRGSHRFWMTGAVAVVTAALGSGRNVWAEEQRHAVTRASPFSVAETVQRIEASVHRRGLNVFARIEQAEHSPLPEKRESTLVVVLESSQGGTPVVMRGEGTGSQSDVPLSLVVRPLSEGASEVVIPSGLDFTDGWRELPREVAADMAELQALVADALK